MFASRGSAWRRSLKARSPRQRYGGALWTRPLKFESLESRLALTTFTVNNLGDAAFNNTDFVVTLRDAIVAANNNVAAFPGGPVGSGLTPDAIQFESGLSGTITLTQGELSLRTPMSINGPGSSNLTISGSNTSRVFNVSNSASSLVLISIRGVTISNGNAFALGGGGIINSESLLVENCLITANRSLLGGGILNTAAGVLTVSNSSIDSNQSDGAATMDDGGSALYNFGQATIRDSSLSTNGGVGEHGPVANLSGGTLTIEDSSILGNFQNTLGGGLDNSGTMTVRRTKIASNQSQGGLAGGVLNSGMATLIDSEISANYDSSTGGISNQSSGNITVLNCTISSNSGSFAGGASNLGAMQLQNSTISGNMGDGAATGGVYNAYQADSISIENCTITQNRAGNGGFAGLRHESQHEAILQNTIIIDNFVGGAATRKDVAVVFPLSGLSSFNLIGVASFFSTLGITDGANGNQVGVTDAKLGPLANNGGLTPTHALLAGSLAIDAGSSGAIPVDMFDLDGDGITTTEPLPLDQRRTGFARVIGNRVDIGAFERQTPSLFGDYNRNNVVDAADYVLWRNTLGTSGLSIYAGADGDGDGTIDQDDYGVWRAHFGETLVPGSGAGGAQSEVLESQAVTSEASSREADHDAVGLAEHTAEPVLQLSSSGTAFGRGGAIAASVEYLELRERQSPRHRAASTPHGKLDQYAVVSSGGNDLTLLLAIDRVGSALRQECDEDSSRASSEFHVDHVNRADGWNGVAGFVGL